MKDIKQANHKISDDIRRAEDYLYKYMRDYIKFPRQRLGINLSLEDGFLIAKGKFFYSSELTDRCWMNDVESSFIIKVSISDLMTDCMITTKVNDEDINLIPEN